MAKNSKRQKVSVKSLQIAHSETSSECKVLPILTLEARIKRGIRSHLKMLGFTKTAEGHLAPPSDTKEAVRRLHYLQRLDRLVDEKKFVQRQWDNLKNYFADGREVIVSKITPRLEIVQTDTWQAHLFKLASLTWSVPISQGYGRRMRFLIWDDNNHKLIGLIGLTDPVFNLRVRDELVGWSADDRRQRLVNVMDAHVLGALPPYNLLLGGKLVACLVRTKEIRDAFAERYSNTRGIISKTFKRPSLVTITTSSALGRSSIYNRLTLNGQPFFYSIGYTSGWGHFHISRRLFELIREYLDAQGDKYANNHYFGQGPNWRLRAIRKAMSQLGFSRSILKHGIAREVFMCMLAKNALEVLGGKNTEPDYESLGSVSDVSDFAKLRWLQPRADRDPRFLYWRKEEVANMIIIRNGAGIDVSDTNTISNTKEI